MTFPWDSFRKIDPHPEGDPGFKKITEFEVYVWAKTLFVYIQFTQRAYHISKPTFTGVDEP
jgi:hypothetical protein